MTTYEHEESMPLGRQEVTRSSSCSVRSKRILIVAGQARSLVNFRGPLLRELRDRGLEVHVAAPRVTDAPVLSATLGDWGIIVHDIPLNRDGLNPLQDLHSLYLLGRLLHSVKPGTLLAYTIKPVIYATLAGWMVGVPRRFALITGMGYAFTDDPGGRRAGVQRVVTFLYSRALRRAHRVFFQNPDDQALCREKGLLPEGISSQVVNGSGVDLDYFGCAPLPEGPPVFLLIARLIADKGIRQYVEAARIVRQRHGKVRFLLLGGMDDKPGAVRQEELDAWNREGVIEYLGYLEDVRPVITMASRLAFLLSRGYALRSNRWRWAGPSSPAMHQAAAKR